MRELNEKEIEAINGGDGFGVAAAGLGGFGTGFMIGAGIGSLGGPWFAPVGGLVGGMVGTVGGVYSYFN